MSFEVNQRGDSYFKIKNAVITGTDKDKPNKWVRYITTTDSYVIRI